MGSAILTKTHNILSLSGYSFQQTQHHASVNQLEAEFKSIIYFSDVFKRISLQVWWNTKCTYLFFTGICLWCKIFKLKTMTNVLTKTLKIITHFQIEKGAWIMQWKVTFVHWELVIQSKFPFLNHKYYLSVLI